ncbi:hypothetical protein Cri9333_1699 [Crinalium epipsammum PCC 9333]|uniref:Uncharacterized protein n=1 Tax=Crinalium epipsammum PCC 9333 TaxID=1173022 RepID=K9VXA7_9CYAN|nr:hypothetical protein [Crinalium epipsammum]AFZ12586.1 hypothetical protein Cri9333_1699 [Crinalium epipsammum PCC 9333]
MNSKLKIHILSRSTEQGFAMIAALGIGLVMFLVGLTMVVRSQGDQTTATAQKSTATAMSAAETGVSRYQSFIDTNREIAIYPDCVTTRTKSGNDWVCSDSGNTNKSWANANALTFSSCASLAGTIASSNKNISWTDVDLNDATKGQYRLVSYTYGPTAGISPGTGVLTIEGRANQKGSGATATNDVGTSTTRLKISIPVLPSKVIPFPFPGMWSKTTVSTDKIAANIIAPCGVTQSSTGSNFVNNGATPWKFVNTNFVMPPVPPTPTTNVATVTYASLPTASVNTGGQKGTITAPILPRAADITSQSNYNSATGEYQYIMTDNINGDLFFTPGYKVAVYLQGDINLTGGQEAIVHKCGTLPNCSATDTRIYGISPNGTANFSLKGNGSICEILFFAPTYDVSLDGGGDAQGCGGGASTNGVYWVKSWAGGGKGSHTALAQSGTNWDDLSFLNFILPPQIAPASTWQRQEVQ